MRNVTLSIEEEILLAARKMALDRHTTVNSLIRDYLKRIIAEDESRKEALDRLVAKMSRGTFKVGDKDWKREDLYE
jgi:hypothetical protein